MKTPASFILLLFAVLGGCAHAPPSPMAPARSAMVASAHPLATQAGLDVLAQGGDAIDAAVAVQAMLGLVEPQSSGIGGGAFMLYYDAAEGRVSAYNGREKAPAGATPDMFLHPDGTALTRDEAKISGRATGVPGVVALLGTAHRDHGRLPWADLFSTTIETARDGFPLTGRTAHYLTGEYVQASTADVQARFAGADGTVLVAGERTTNPDYADTLTRIASEGAEVFYTSPAIAGAIVARSAAPPLPGAMTLADLQSYSAERAEPLCRPYRVWLVCVPPPPSSGVTLLQILGILEATDIAERGPDDPQAWFLFAEASRLAYADRDRYVGDPAFVEVPLDAMLDPEYLAARRAMIGNVAMPPPEAGEFEMPMPGRDRTDEPSGTSHFVVVDADGNSVSMTTTVESYFGSGRTVSGFFLNNQMTDFSFSPVEEGRPAANAAAGGKQPRSSMVPTIILTPEGEFVAALGSPGGSAIIAYVAKSTVAMLDWGLSPDEAIALPNLVSRGDQFRGEAHVLSPGTLAYLAERGIAVQGGSGEESGLHAVRLTEDGLVGGADRRRDGTVQTVEAGAIGQ